MSEEVLDKEIKLVSCDKKEFVVKQKVAFMSELIKQMYTVSSETSQEIMIQDVEGDILTRVIEFCISEIILLYEQVAIMLIIQ